MNFIIRTVKFIMSCAIFFVVVGFIGTLMLGMGKLIFGVLGFIWTICVTLAPIVIIIWVCMKVVDHFSEKAKQDK